LKRLILGAIPNDFDAKNDLPIGPFCFINRWKIFPEWETLQFPPDPFQTIESILSVEKEVINSVNGLLYPLIDDLNNRNKSNYSEQFWRIMLIPYLYGITYAFIERKARLIQFINKFKDNKIYVRLISKDINWNFKNTLDFVHNGLLTQIFNEWIFSRIIENILPTKWVSEYYVAQEVVKSFDNTEKSNSRSLKQKIIENINYFRCSNVAGIRPIESILWSAFLSIKPIRKAKSKNISYPIINDEKLIDDDLRHIVLKTMPKSLSEISKLRIPNCKPRPGRIRLIGPPIYYDDRHKYFLAKCVEGGEKIICTQHGGGGCNLKYFPMRAEVEYNQYKYFSWGWNKHENYPGNIKPLPSPYLAKYKAKHNEKNENIILVGTTAHLYSYRLSSEPQAMQRIEYRKGKIEFINRIDKKYYPVFYYRPDFNENGALKDYSFVKRKFPLIKIIKNNFHNEQLKARLLVLDHPGTTLSIAFAANIPTICFWNKNHWTMNTQSEPYFKAMKDAGILFESGKDAAEKLNNIYNNTQSWWQQPSIQAVLDSFCNQYARSSKLWRWEWAKELWEL
jgi:putative transferase (TIGR04331 family)